MEGANNKKWVWIAWANCNLKRKTVWAFQLSPKWVRLTQINTLHMDWATSSFLILLLYLPLIQILSVWGVLLLIILFHLPPQRCTLVASNNGKPFFGFHFSSFKIKFTVSQIWMLFIENSNVIYLLNRNEWNFRLQRRNCRILWGR